MIYFAIFSKLWQNPTVDVLEKHYHLYAVKLSSCSKITTKNEREIEVFLCEDRIYMHLAECSSSAQKICLKVNYLKNWLSSASFWFILVFSSNITIFSSTNSIFFVNVLLKILYQTPKKFKYLESSCQDLQNFREFKVFF